MSRKLLFFGVMFLLLAALLVTPFSVLAEGDPPPDPEPIQAPWITGVNPSVEKSTAPAVDLDPSGLIESWKGVDLSLMTGSPDFVELEPQADPVFEPGFDSLAVPQLYQDPNDATCGAASLGMALEFLALNGEGNAPSQAALVGDLKEAGLLYETGTGVEELAYLARNHGYQGTTAFHDWTLAQLQEQLDAGNPVVVSLGSNGEDQTGHFVTLTGISEDGKWVSYNDPVLGKQIVSTEDFQSLWEIQGNAGLVAHKEPLSAVDDAMLPWMGLFSALAALAVIAKQVPLGEELTGLISMIRGALADPRRKGLGGQLVPVYEWRKVQDGTKVIQDTSKKIYEYGTRWIQDGWKTITDYGKKIYEYGTRWVQDGWKTVTDYSKKIYEYGTRWVQRGWKTVKDTTKKIYEYGTRLVQKGWKTVKDTSKKIYEYGTRWVQKGFKKVTSWVKGVWGWFKKTKWVPKIVKEKFVKGWHYATKKVPKMVKETFVKGWHYATKTVPKMVKETFVKSWQYATKKVPKMVKETFVKSWQYATKTVPKMVKETFIKGWHYATKVVPNYIFEKVQVGWEEVKQTAQDSILDPDWWRQELADAVSSVAEFFNRATQGAQAITGLVEALLNAYHNAPWYTQAGISIVPGADLVDIGAELQNWIEGEEVDKWVLGLAAVGLVMDVGVLDGVIPDPADAGNAFFAAVKSLLKVMPDGASRKLIEEMLLDPSQYNHLYKTLIALQSNGDEMAALLKNDEALAVALRKGPEALEIVLDYGDEAIEIMAKHGDDGLAAVQLFGDDAVSLISSSEKSTEVVDYLLKYADEGTNVAAEASEAISAANRLKDVRLNTSEADELIDSIVRGSTHGSGSRVVLGPYGADGVYIKEALDNGGIFYHTPPGTWEALGESKELAWSVNEQFLREQLENGIPRIDFVGETISEAKAATGTFRSMEVTFLDEVATSYGYKLMGNSWVKIP